VFDLKRPCVNCQFRKGQGEFFQLHPIRLAEIYGATAFQCHRTLAHLDDGEHWQGDRPQQCAGLMAVLAREGAENQIMQVAQRLGHLDVAGLDPDREAYDTWADVLAAHSESA
jgi:hypothetical protein